MSDPVIDRIERETHEQLERERHREQLRPFLIPMLSLGEVPLPECYLRDEDLKDGLTGAEIQTEVMRMVAETIARDLDGEMLRLLAAGETMEDIFGRDEDADWGEADGITTDQPPP